MKKNLKKTFSALFLTALLICSTFYGCRKTTLNNEQNPKNDNSEILNEKTELESISNAIGINSIIKKESLNNFNFTMYQE